MDEGAGRKYWPIKCNGDVDLAGLERDRDQLWAESVAVYREGIRGRRADGSLIYAPCLWWFARKDLGLVAEENAKREPPDPVKDAVVSWFLSLGREARGRGFLSSEIVRDALREDQVSRSNQTRLGRALKALGFTRQRRGDGLYYYAASDTLKALPDNRPTTTLSRQIAESRC